MTYLMENHFESQRLISKTDCQSTKRQLIEAGFAQLPPHSNIIDAGCGPGIVSQVMSELAQENKTHITLNLIDLSEQRLQDAKHALLHSNCEINYITSDLAQIPLQDQSQDFIFCRFVFEYLQNPDQVLQEFIRILRPGGKVVISDLDANMMSHYPIPKELETKLQEIMEKLHDKNIFDPFVGRKLYSMFHLHQLENIEVSIEPHHLFYGELPQKDYDNWLSKYRRLSQLVEDGSIDLSFDVQEFTTSFMSFLNKKDSFSYTPMMIVSGTKKEVNTHI